MPPGRCRRARTDRHLARSSPRSASTADWRYDGGQGGRRVERGWQGQAMQTKIAGVLSKTVVALVIGGTAVQAPTAPVPDAVQRAAEREITAPALEAPIRFLADDLLEGRGPSTRGDRL